MLARSSFVGEEFVEQSPITLRILSFVRCLHAIRRGKEALERKLVRVEVRIERRFSSRRRQSASINYHAENEITRRRCSESHVHVTIHAPCDDATPPNDVTRREVTMRPSSTTETPSDTCSVIFLSSRNDAAHHPLNGLEFSKKRAPTIAPPTVTRSPCLNACHRLSNGREVLYSVKGR